MDNEVYERMCKKIAQLTRVIFVLNTKNDENDALIESIVEAYEKEIESLTKEASSVITTMKKAVEKMKENLNVDEKINSINKKYDDSVYGFTLDYDKFKKEATRKEKQIIEDYQEKYDKMWKDLADIRKIYETKISDMSRKLEEDRKQLIAEKEHIKNSLNKELENTNKNYIEKINAINEENKNKEERMRQEFQYVKDKLLEEYEKKIFDLNKLLDNNSNSNSKVVEDMRNDYEKKLKQLKDEKDSLDKTNTGLKSEIESLLLKIKELENLCNMRPVYY